MNITTGAFASNVRRDWENGGGLWLELSGAVSPVIGLVATVGESWPQLPVSLVFRDASGAVVCSAMANTPGVYRVQVPFALGTQFAGKTWHGVGNGIPITWASESSCVITGYGAYAFSCDSAGRCFCGVPGYLNLAGTKIAWENGSSWEGVSALVPAAYHVTASIIAFGWEVTVAGI